MFSHSSIFQFVERGLFDGPHVYPTGLFSDAAAVILNPGKSILLEGILIVECVEGTLAVDELVDP